MAAGCTSPSVAGLVLNSKASAIVIQPLQIVKTQDLNFGGLIAGTTAGTATVDAFTGAVTTTGGTSVYPSSSQYAAFETYGQTGKLLSIYYVGSLPTLTRATGTETMQVTALTINNTTTSWPIISNGPINFQIGAVLKVAANQRLGVYSGTFTILAYYQ